MEELLYRVLQAFKDNGYTIMNIKNAIHIVSGEQDFIFIDGIPISCGVLENDIFVFMDLEFYPISGININAIASIDVTQDSIIFKGKDNKEIVLTYETH